MSYLFTGMSLYWLFTGDGGLGFPRWIRITLGALFAVCGVVSCYRDVMREQEMERMRWDD